MKLAILKWSNLELKKCQLGFDEITTIIGENNAGKTALLAFLLF